MTKENSGTPSPFPNPLVLWLAGGVGLGLIVTLLIGVHLASGDGQTPTESYVLTSAQTVLSISAGLLGTLIFEQIKSKTQKNQFDVAAESAAHRLFATLATLGRVLELTSQSKSAAAARLSNIEELARTAFLNVDHSVNDWTRLAPGPVERALKEARTGRDYRVDDNGPAAATED